MTFTFRLVIFLGINFGVLALGSLSMGGGPASEWYVNLNQAPWTPPGWVFGVAWFSLMLCFSIYMALLWKASTTLTVKILYFLQVLLNGSWNYAFFNQHLVLLALIIILSLLTTVVVLAFNQRKELGVYTLFAFPYMIWLTIAISLNAYIYLYN